MLQLHLVSPYGDIYHDHITKMTVPTEQGYITILSGHIPLISVLHPGEVVLTKEDGHQVHLAVSYGVVEVRKQNVVYLMADTAERAEQIDIQRAEKAKETAEQLLRQDMSGSDDATFALFQAKMKKEIARIKVGKKYQS